jgi:hypothetical protein
MHSDIFVSVGASSLDPLVANREAPAVSAPGLIYAKTIRGSPVTLGYVGGTEPTGDKTRSSFFRFRSLTMFPVCSLINVWLRGTISICLTWWSSGTTLTRTSRS